MRLFIYFIVSLILLASVAIAGSADVWLECGSATCSATNPPTCQKTMGTTTYYCCPGPVWTTKSDCSFDFSVSVSPTSGSVAPGSSISPSPTVTVALLTGPTQSVLLLPAVSPYVANGPTVSFTPSSGNPTYTSTMSISTVATTPTGTYNVIITGTGGGLIKTAPYSLTVTSGGVGEVCNDYPIDNDGDGLIDCNDPDCTGSVYCPPAPPPCTPTYVNNCDSTDGCGYTRSTGSYNPCALDVAQACGTETACNDGYDNDCDGLIDSSVPNPDPDCVVPPGSFNFAVSLDSTSGSVITGSGKTPTVTVSLVSGTAQTVSLTWAISPSVANGPTVSLNPSSGTPNPTYPSTLTIDTTGTTPAGTYTITVTGTGGGLTRTATYTLTVSSVAGCGNTICELGETQENCPTDCKTTITISPYWVNPGDTATVTVSFSDSRFNPVLNDANITLKIDDIPWTNCVINNRKWKTDIGWDGLIGTWISGATTIESSNYNGKVTATCTIPPGTAIGVHTLVAKPTIYSESIELKGSETKIVVMDGFLKLLRFLIQPLKLLF